MADNDGDNSSNDDSSSESNNDSAQSQGNQGGSNNGTDWQAELDKWKAEAESFKQESRKHESRARANAKELETLKRGSMTEQQRAIAEAVDQAKELWKTELGTKLAVTEFKAKATSRLGDEAKVNALLPNLNVNAFLNDDGEPNSQAIDNFLDTIAPAKSSNTFDFGQGPRGNGQGSATSLADDPFMQDILKLSGFKQ